MSTTSQRQPRKAESKTFCDAWHWLVESLAEVKMQNMTRFNILYLFGDVISS